MNVKRDEAGFTLVELLVASAVAALIMSFLGAAIFQFLTSTDRGHDRLSVVRDHGNAFQWLNHDGQMAVSSLAQVNPSDVTLSWTDITAGTTYASSYVQSGGELVRTLTTNGTPASQTVARNLAPSGFSASRSSDLLIVSITSTKDNVSQTRTETVQMRVLAATAAPFATLPPTATPTSTWTPTPTPTRTPTSTPTPSCTAANTGFRNPSAQAADTGGNGNGFEVSPTNAFADAGGYAENTNGAGDRHRYYDYGISIPAGCPITGIEVRLDWWLSSTLDTNSMDVELSWNGGASWTAVKTDAVESDTEHTTVLGGSTDTWGRAWTAAELSNANFRVRVTTNCSGFFCSFRDFFLDWVPVNVSYAPATPTPTITPTPSCTLSDTGFLDPSAEAADTGGTGNGFEVSPSSAFTNGASNAENNNGAGDRHRFYNYGISIPAGCAVKGIEVRLDWWLDSTIFSTSSMSVELSWDSGASWTAAKTDSTEHSSEQSDSHYASFHVLGGSSDTWGRSWTASELSNANFRVQLTSNSSSSFRDFFLDWVPVNVSYGP